jgi:hypothetical protein
MVTTETREDKAVSPRGEETARGAAAELRRPATTVGGATAIQSFIAAGAAALAVIGLVGVLPLQMAAIATLAVGAILVAEGAGITTRYRTLLHALNGSRYEVAEAGGGATPQTLAGIGGVALSILALLGVAPISLLAVAALVYGGGILLGSAAQAQLETIASRAGEHGESGTSRRALTAGAGSRVLVAATAAVLGILVLIGAAAPSVPLILVAMLVIAGTTLLASSAIGGRLGTAV